MDWYQFGLSAFSEQTGPIHVSPDQGLGRWLVSTKWEMQLPVSPKFSYFESPEALLWEQDFHFSGFLFLHVKYVHVCVDDLELFKGTFDSAE